MAKLVCDICGGQLVVQSGGQSALCETCGVAYGLERLREKLQDMGVATKQESQCKPAQEIGHLRQLVERYYAVGDFLAAEATAKKILEVLPSDVESSRLYDELQTLKFMEIKNGVLVRYTGRAEKVIVPDCVTEIGERAFSEANARKLGNDFLKEVVLSDHVREIGREAFGGCGHLEVIRLPKGLQEIGDWVFCGCSRLEEIDLPREIKAIGRGAFCNCEKLKKVNFPKGLEQVGEEAFRGCCSLTAIIIPPTTVLGEGCFMDCSSLAEMEIAEGQIYKRIFAREDYDADDGGYWYSKINVPWYIAHEASIRAQERERQQADWRASDKCQHCGGGFGLFSNKCVRCGRRKDY